MRALPLVVILQRAVQPAQRIDLFALVEPWRLAGKLRH
jgi:hypothetical protein